MNELFIAYDAFWGSFVNTFGSVNVNPTTILPPGSPVRAHRSGNPAIDGILPNGTPIPARFPHIVYDAIQPGLFSNAVSSVSIWDRDLMPTGAPGRPNFYGRVNDIAQQILDKIHPETGVDLIVGERGIITLYRGSVPFQIAPTGEDDATFARAVIGLYVRGRLF